jgi:hypothetical protein
MSDEPEDKKPTRVVRAIGSGAKKPKKRDVVVHSAGEFERKAFTDDVAFGMSDERKDVSDSVFDSLSMGERIARHLFKRDPTVDEIVRCVEMAQHEQRFIHYEEFEEDMSEDGGGTG